MEIKINTQTKTLTIINQISIKEFKELVERFNIGDDWNIISEYQNYWYYPTVPYTPPTYYQDKYIVNCDSTNATNVILTTT